jgi:hypothetical protein
MAFAASSAASHGSADHANWRPASVKVYALLTLAQDMRAGVASFIVTFASEILGQSSIALFLQRSDG